MAGWLEPVGPEPTRVYWIRRALVVAAVIVVIAVVVGIVTAVTGGNGTAATAKSVGASTKKSPTPTPTPAAPASSKPPSPTPTATPSASSRATQPAGPTDCDPAKLGVQLAGERSVKIGTETTFTVTVQNNATAACQLAIKPTTFAVTISSGDDRIWSTADCGDWLAAPPAATVEPGKSAQWQLRWNTTRSQPGCTLSSEVLQGGTYVARASLTGGPTGSLVMDLHG